MFRAAFVAACLGLLLVGSGCQCCQLTETVGDVADAVSVHQCAWDGLYSPCYDLNRIGRRDWCAYRVNRWLCPCRCEQLCPQVCPHCP